MKNPGKTAVVILNWNGQEFLKQFLPGVVENTPEAEIWVVDNASTDDSVIWVSENCPSVLTLVLKENLGFAGGYNEGLAQIEADTFVLLNSDVEVTPGWLAPMLHWLEEDPKMAACQPTILDFNKRDTFEHAGAAGGYLDAFGFPFCAGRIFDSFEKDEGQFAAREEVFWATGACLVIRAQLYKLHGGLDKDFFAHMEEIDLCWRLKNLGYKVGACRSSKVYHVGGGTLKKINPFKTFLIFRNNLSLLVKNDHQGSLFLKIVFRMVLDALAAYRFLFEGKLKDFFAVIRAHFAFYTQLPKLLKQRKALAQNRLVKVPTCRYQRSIVWDYYAKKRTHFKELEQSRFS